MHSSVSDLDLHYFPGSHLWDARYIWVNLVNHDIWKNKRIFNGHEVLIELSVRKLIVRITRLAEWCRTVIPSDPIFNSNRTSITDSFSYILFFWQLYLGLNMCCFINFTLRTVTWNEANIIEDRSNISKLLRFHYRLLDPQSFHTRDTALIFREAPSHEP